MAQGPKIPSDLAAIRRLFRGYKDSAKKKNLAFEITERQFINLITKECFYCGRPPVALSIRVDISNPGKTFYNSLDRIKGECGYKKHNIVTCCITCNRMKSNFPVEDFLGQVYRIYMHIIKR